MPWISSRPRDAREALAVLKRLDSVLGVCEASDSGTSSALEQAEQWCRDLDSARTNKQYDEADEIRKKIIDAGFEVRTSKEGSVIQKKLL